VVDWMDPDKRHNSKSVFNSSYDNATVRLCSRDGIEMLRDVPNYAGQFRWTGHDYLGEANIAHGGWPFKAFMGGAIDLAGFEKDLYYLYQSQWTAKPMVHILPHWTHPVMKLDTLVPVWVYSNCEQVELFLNGKSLGRQKPGLKGQQMQCEWRVPYRPGEISAKGYRDGREVATMTHRTASAPAILALDSDTASLKEDRRDIAQVTVKVQDHEGHFYPYGENRVGFHLEGPARIRALGNGSPVDVEPHFGVMTRRPFFGLAKAFVQATGKSGSINLLAASILGEKKQLTSNRVHIHSTWLNLRGNEARQAPEIHYTLDGSEPDSGSVRYTVPFSVKPGTTVKALVRHQGHDVIRLSESFGTSEGLSWKLPDPSLKKFGDQAEDTNFSRFTEGKEFSGYHGRSYLDLRGNGGGMMEYYYENDGPKSKAELVLRYSSARPKGEKFELNVKIRGERTRFPLEGTGAWNNWETARMPVWVKPGANSFIITSEQGDHLDILLDEVQVNIENTPLRNEN
jgi:beta-galactosidase